MPDLSHEAVHQFWRSYQDPTIYRVICFMEGVEDWTHDNDPELEKAIQALGKTLDNNIGIAADLKYCTGIYKAFELGNPAGNGGFYRRSRATRTASYHSE